MTWVGGAFDKVLFGSGWTQRDKSRDDISNDWTNGSGQYGTLYNTAGCPVQCSPYSFGSQGFNVISMVESAQFHARGRGILSHDPAAAECGSAAAIS